ncbi:hypothetical protein [Alishewanella sp. HH-ZS]|uniref:hypothetical protein n=1 Tax=Alishewanella sp. HH-ZS TaxID=1856684 RepID=UPI00082366D8|nr:hypothetical protein [Alishewanella sp. HH-ZS]OCW97293.1 hypothetical protein A9165_07015 [Alishewanella sp. HH-ZS]
MQNLWSSWSRLEYQLFKPFDAKQQYGRLVSDYVACSCRLASQLAFNANPLLQEWCLRQGLFNLAQAAMRHKGNPAAQQPCLDQLYLLLLALNRFYQQQHDGKSRQLALQASLNQIFYQGV